MINRRSLLQALPIAGASVLAAARTGFAASAAAELRLVTGTVGGTYYAVGVALETLMRLRLEPSEGIGLTAIPSAGSGDNIRLLDAGEADLAMLQGLFGALARNGDGVLAAGGPRRDLRSVASVWPNVEHFLVHRADTASGTFGDFAGQRGRRVSLGLRDSGALVSSSFLLATLGIAPDTDFELVHIGFDETAEAMIKASVSSASMPGGPPVPAVRRLFETVPDIVMLSFSEDEAARINDIYNDLWSRWVVAPGTYPGLANRIPTLSQPNFLAARAALPDEVVYRVTRTIFENLSFLQALHPATSTMRLETALSGLQLPLHPGALRYYEEEGIAVPARLQV